MAQETTVAVKINASTGGTESVKSLKAQIQESQREAEILAQKFGALSPEAMAAAEKVAKLKSEMGDLGARIAALNPDKFARIETMTMGIARGIQAATGAMALFGVENENATKALVKIQAAMAFAEGITGIMALKAAFGAFFTSVIAGFRAMSAAMIATGIGAILVLVGSAVSMLIDLFSDQEAETKRLEAETRRLEQAYKDLTTSYEEWADNHDFITEKIIKKAERENATEEEILNLKKQRNLSSIKELEKHMGAVAKQYDEEKASIIKNTKTRSEEEKQLREMNKRKEDQFAEFTKRIRDMRQADTLLAEDILMAQKKAEEKAAADAQKRYEDYQRIVKAQQDAERNALQSLNEEKRKLREFDAKNAIELENIKLQNELQRLAEQRDNALRADNLTNKAKADINAKFDASEQIARKNNAKAIEAINKDLAAKEAAAIEERRAAREKFAADTKTIQDKEIADTIAATDKLYANKKNQLILQGAAQAEFDNLEIQRLEAQLQNAKDYGELTKDETLRIEAELATKRKEIRDKDVANTKAAEEAKRQMQLNTLQSVSSILGSLADLAGKNEKTQKAFALAQIATDTAIALSNAQASAFSPTSPDNAVTGGLAGVAKYASYVAIILSNAAKARQILKGGGSGGSGSAAPAPNAPQTTPITGGTLPDTEAGQFAGMGKVYVLEGDITKTQTRVRRVRNVSVV